MSGHTKEPWVFRTANEDNIEHDIVTSDGTWIIACTADGVDGGSNSEANARRIVACVNALQHISTEILESGHMQNLVMQVRIAEEQRDELLAALRAYQNAGFGQSTDFYLQGKAYDLANEAIEKAEAA